MRALVLLLCAGEPSSAVAAAPWTVSKRAAAVALPAGASLLRFTVEGEESVDFQVVLFAADRCTLRVVDQPVKSSAGTLGAAMTRINAIAGVNGGFFSPEFAPLGLVISQGKRVGSWQKSSLTSGTVVVRKGRLMLIWRDEFQDGPGITELLQTGPRLVNHGLAIKGLEVGRNRPRTFIATDSEGHWLIGTAQYTSLAHLAQILAAPGLVPGLKVDRALNFDGGRSTGLWLRTAVGEVQYDEEISTVRNFVAVIPKGS
ncbi:MAG: Protein of unknown function periplasmic [Verrucomicrobiaceae bacterium]|nr:Protein of unknown function periplasmic [Verrucomicrobiaceae bacterium]